MNTSQLRWLDLLRLWPWQQSVLFGEYFPMGRRNARPQVKKSAQPANQIERRPGPRPEPRSLPQIRWHLAIYRLPKLGYTLQECEDAWAYANKDFIDVCRDYETYPPRTYHLRFGAELAIAISDGATESFASALWAEILTFHAVNDALDKRDRDNRLQANLWSYMFDTETPLSNKLLDEFRQWVAAKAKLWKRQANQWRVAESGGNVPWFIEAKAERGSHATLLVLLLQYDEPSHTCHYRVMAIGDNCLFHWRDGRLFKMVPDLLAEQFTVSPQLIGTDTDYNRRYLTVEGIQRSSGQFSPGDQLWLATDSLSAWITKESQTERQANQLKKILVSEERQNLSQVFDQLRSDSRMKNDDITLVRLRWVD